MRIGINDSRLRLLSSLIVSAAYKPNVYVVGGYVRDLVLGRKSEDIDLVVDSQNPKESFVLATLLAKGLGVYSHGRNPEHFGQFHIARLAFQGEKIEIAVPRREIYQENSRNPEVETCSLEEDANRRDFTVNSMYIDIATGEIKDFLGGLTDLRKGIVRCVGNPDMKFSEDPLRMFRCIRFASRFLWRIEDETWRGILRQRERALILTPSRIQHEISQMLLQPNSPHAIRLLGESGLISCFDSKIDWKNEERVKMLDRLSSLELKLAYLGCSHNSLSLLDFPVSLINEVGQLSALAGKWKRSCSSGIPEIRCLRALWHETSGRWNDVLLLLRCDRGFSYASRLEEIFEGLLRNGENPLSPSLPVNGKDLMREFSISPSPLIREILSRLWQEKYQRGNLTREDAMRIAACYISENYGQEKK